MLSSLEDTVLSIAFHLLWEARWPPCLCARLSAFEPFPGTLCCVRGQDFKAEKRTKDARALASRQAPERNGAELRRSCERKHYVLPVSSSIFTSLMESWCIIFAGIQFFTDQIKVSEAFTYPLHTENFGAKTHFFHIHVSEQR